MTEDAGLSTRRALLGSLLILFVTGIARMIAMQVVGIAVGADLESEDPIARKDGILLAAGILGGVSMGGLAMAWVVRPAPRAALGLSRPSVLAVIVVALIGAGLVAGFDGLAVLLDRPLVEAAWRDVYRTAPVALLATALIATSIFEELFLRGVMFGGIAKTRIGAPGAVVITSLLFALAHFPDDAVRFFDVLSSGVFLAIARHITKSTIPGMIPHVLGNLKVLGFLAATT